MKRWTLDEIALLRAKYPDTDTGALAAELGRTVWSLQQKAHVLGLTKSVDFVADCVKRNLVERGTATRFRPGQVSHNKGKRFNPGGRSVETRFKSGSLPHNTRHDGATTWRHDGYLWLRIGLKKWVLYHRWVYEQHHGIALQPTDVVRFLDGNRKNFDPENLILTDRRGHMLGNTIHRYPEDVKTAIRSLTKLKKAIRHATTGTTTANPANPADQ